MRRIFNAGEILDQAAMKKGLDELILMENAGAALARVVRKKSKKFKRARVLFLLGGGKNAADGLVALRHLSDAKAYKLGFRECGIFKKQEEILKNYGFEFLEKEPDFEKFDLIVDCIFGRGFRGDLDAKTAELIQKASSCKAFKIACDLPSGLGSGVCFRADLTLCMGALKESLLEDFAKESVGRLRVAHLGVEERHFAPSPEGYLLQKKDLRLIERKGCSNKGDYGHVCIAGSASAGTLAGLGALEFGAGLVSLVGNKSFSPLLMLKDKIAADASAAALGMGLEDLEILRDGILQNIPLVLDAACFSSEEILPFLRRPDVVLTPHPKEFTRLYRLCFGEDLSVEAVQKNRFFYARKFARAHPCVLILKGANLIIVQNEALFVVDCGTAALAKGGSGDVLAGMVAALLGAGFAPLEAAKNAVLAHALVAQKYRFNANSFDALKLIEGLKCL